MFKILNNLVAKVIIFIVVMAFLVINIYINTYSRISQNKYTKSFNSSVEQHNISITEFLSTLESAIEMLSENEMIQNVSDNPDKYYNSTLELLRNFQQAYSSTAFAYFATEKKIFGIKKLVSWPDTSEELSNTNWEPSLRPWYINAINSKGKIAWTKPYTDSTTKKNLITVSKEVMDKDNHFKGVMAIDIYIDDLSKKINYFREFNEGDMFIISRTDKDSFFIIDNVQNEVSKSIFDKNLIDNLYMKKSGNFNFSDLTGDYYISYTTNAVTGWKVVGVIKQQHLVKETKNIISNIIIGVVAIVFMSIIFILYITKQMGSTIQTLSGSIKATEEKKLTPSKKMKLFEIDNEEVFLEKPTSNINILFEVEAEKEKINQLLKNFRGFNISNAKDLGMSINRLASYIAKLNPSLKSHEIQRVSLNNFLLTIRDYINSQRQKSILPEFEAAITELNTLIDTILNSQK